MQTFHRDFSLQRCLLVGSFLAMASASASTLIGSAGDPDLDEVGELSGWVEARTVCPHLHQLHCALQHRLPVFDTPCQRCDDLQENWTCLSCCEVYCGRYINGHMLWHHQSTLHPMAISFRYTVFLQQRMRMIRLCSVDDQEDRWMGGFMLGNAI
eukprot:c22700_g1_i1 orf=230-694(+)